MSEALYVLALAAVTSLLAVAGGLRWARLDRSALGPAFVRLLEWAGLAVAFYAANMLVGVMAVVLIRKATGVFLSLYVNTDSTLVVLSGLQAIVLQWWRTESA